MFKNLFILLLLISVKSFAQLPANIGFEEGSFNHWNCSAGSIDANGNITLNNSAPIFNRHTLYYSVAHAGEYDRYGNFPVSCPNGSGYSIRLGNDSIGKQAESVSYTFIVPNQSYSIAFNYAVVFQNPNHLDYQQPKFTARIYDITDDLYIDCPYFNFVAGSALPGFQLSATKAALANGNNAKEVAIYYKPWSTATIDLHGYSGKQMRLEFTTNDCTLGGHFGYAYLDIDEGLSASPITGNNYCENDESVVLKGPEGFSDYLWYNDSDLATLLGTGQKLTISPPPPDGTQYTLKVLPYKDLGCDDILRTVVTKINDLQVFKVIDTLRGCPETGVNLTDQTITAGSSDGFRYQYFADAGKHQHLRDSTKVFLSGTYFIEAISSIGCTHTLPVHVKLIPPIITVTQPAPAVYPATVDITKTFVKQDSFTYSYYADASATIPLSNYTAISKSGNYYIKVKNTFGCELVTVVQVVCLPPPPYIVTGPNVFTPNNDGINDNFGMHIEGYVRFDDLTIFNRYGQLMFTTKSQSTTWDGKYSGHELPAGTYYWIFNGIDTYYNVPIKKSGYISIIR